MSISLAATDTGSGVDRIVYTLDGTDPTPISQSYTAPFEISAPTTVKFRAYDRVGNEEAVGSQAVLVDTVPPTTGIQCENGTCDAWYPDRVRIELFADDAESGWSEIRYTTDGSEPTRPNGQVYEESFRVFETTTIKVRAYDEAGNESPVATHVVGIDQTPPSTSIRCNGGECTGFYTSEVTVELTAVDTGSGVDEINYTTDGSEPTGQDEYVGPFTVDESTLVRFRAEDEVGNEEWEQSTSVVVEKTAPPAPALTFSGFSNAAAAGGTVYFRPGASGGFTVRAAATDPESGIREVAFPSLGSGWTGGGTDTADPFEAVYEFAADATDPDGAGVVASNNADLASEPASLVIAPDADPPTVSIGCNGTGCDAAGYGDDVAVSLAASDPLSGVAEIRYTTDGSEPTRNGGIEYTTPFTLVSTVGVKYRAYDRVGNEGAVVTSQVRINPPPDPADVAPPLDTSVPTDPHEATSFLYTGDDPIQKGVEPGTIEPRRTTHLRGKVLGRDGTPLEGVRISVLGHEELGRTRTRDDGMFDLVVNGGDRVTIEYQKENYLPAQRGIEAPNRDATVLEDVVLIPLDDEVSEVDLSANDGIDVARGSPVTDANGTRQATLLFKDGTDATMTLPDGTERPLDELHVRASEYTIGENGPEAMPGELPPTSGYTYAAEFSVDEAVAAKATGVEFDNPVAVYVENFLEFPTGEIVPVGRYDRERGVWLAEENGRVIEIVGEAGGRADIDADGDGDADSDAELAALGVTSDERGELASLYDAGDSLWRASLKHFSPVDLNFPWGPPTDAVAPNQPRPRNPSPKPPPQPKPCHEQGSEIGCLRQTLGERLPVTGTPFSLHYSSDDVPGRKVERMLEIPLTGPSIPPLVDGIALRISVAGRTFSRRFAPDPNLSHTFTWDGKDAFGRAVQGTVPVTVSVGHVYAAVYYGTADNRGGRRWAQLSMDPRVQITSGQTRAGGSAYIVWATWKETLTSWDLRAGPGLGGWTLDAVHLLDFTAREVRRGDGERQRSPEVLGVVAGGGDEIAGGVPADRLDLGAAQDLDVGPDGSVYVVDDNRGTFGNGPRVVRRISPQGHSSIVAGMHDRFVCPASTADQASRSPLCRPSDVAVGPDGAVYVADDCQVFKVTAPTEPMRSIAGIRGACRPESFPLEGEGGISTEARLGTIWDLEVGPDGAVYLLEGVTFTDENRQTNHASFVRRLAPDVEQREPGGLGGHVDRSTILTTYAGALPGLTAEDVAAVRARLHGTDMAFGPDGSLYLARGGDQPQIWRIGPDGVVSRFAGTGARGVTGDGGPAASASLCLGGVPLLDVGTDGTVYMLGNCGEPGPHIRKVAPDGIISKVAGTYRRCNEADDESGHAQQACLGFNIWAFAVGSNDELYFGSVSFGDGETRVKRVQPQLPDVAESEVVVPSDSGREVYAFDRSGRHLRTLDALTGSLRLRFGYDGDGRLVSVTDGDGNVTTVERNGAGQPTAIVAPGGQRTALAVNGDGYLASVTPPGTPATAFTYAAEGLLATLTDARGGVFEFAYDEIGRLVRDENPAGDAITLHGVDNAAGRSVILRRPSGRETEYNFLRLPNGDIRQFVADSTGARTEILIGIDGTSTATYPNGVTMTLSTAPDPRFGMNSPVLKQLEQRSPSGRVRRISGSRTTTRSNPSDPFSVATLTETLTINGQTSTTTYDAATRTATRTSPGGRRQVTTLDARGRVVRVEPAAGIDAIVYTYDTKGRVSAVEQGAQRWTFTYDAANRVVSRSDASGRQTLYTYDAADRVATVTLPSSRVYSFAYDANGRRTSIEMPSGAFHGLTYTALNQRASYTPPGAGGPYAWSYNANRARDTFTLPGGRVVGSSYKPDGRDAGVAYAEASVTFDYADATDRASSIGRDPAGPAGPQTVDFAYDADLVTRATSTGAANSVFNYSYDDNGFLTGIALDAGAEHVATALTRDADGLITQQGPFTFNRDGPGGSLSKIVDASLDATYGYDTLGRQESRAQSVGGAGKYTSSIVYDSVGRVTRKDETVEGTAHRYDYRYDADGQLLEVKRDDVVVESYAYDANGNRTTPTATYDTQDRLVSLGGVNYVFDADGFLAERGADRFQYTAKGELSSATVDGVTVTYQYDGLGRRVARATGTSTTQFLYGDPANPLRLTAIREPAGALTTLYYADDGLLFAFARGGSRYYVATDQVGTPRVVTDASGAVVKAVEYDTFGVILSDSNPGFELPLGFAGGLADPITGLVLFGFRDYEPASGRWTARDPIFFAGGQGNLYVYVGNSPIALRDPSGLICVGYSQYQGVGAGAKLCYADGDWSLCVEVGVGLGAGVSVSPFEGAAESGWKPKAEAGLGCGPLSLSVGVEYGDCGLDWSGKGGFGAFSVDTNGTLEVGGDPADLGKSVSKLSSFADFDGCKGQAKLVVEACVKF